VSFALGQLRVAHGNLSCRKGRMLPHTGLFLLGKVALQMRIRRRLKIFILSLIAIVVQFVSTKRMSRHETISAFVRPF
ncbi:TPA: hypothetical protein ACFOV7_000234, partial [Neisseria meningitidis]